MCSFLVLAHSPYLMMKEFYSVCVSEIDWGGIEWIQLAQDRDRWQALVNTVINLRVLVPRSQSASQSAPVCACVYHPYVCYFLMAM
jgi:hypothetical protein